MDLPKNHFKAALTAGKQQIGIWWATPEPGHAESVAGCGFDWMLVDTAQSVVTLPTAQVTLQTAPHCPTPANVRPGWNDPMEIKRLLDAGAQMILIPYVQTADEAARPVTAVRHPPRGLRGVAGVTPASRCGMVADYSRSANAEISLVVPVETAQGPNNIEAIAAVKGIDGLVIRAADLAASMDHPGAPDAPEVCAAVLDGIRRIGAAGKTAGVLTLEPDCLRQAVAAGTAFTAVNGDGAILPSGARELARQWKG